MQTSSVAKQGRETTRQYRKPAPRAIPFHSPCNAGPVSASVRGADFVIKNFPNVKVVKNPVNGCASGRNLGVSLAKGKYLDFCDSDQWFTSSSFFVEALHILSRDASVGVVGWAAGWFDRTRSDLGGMIADYSQNRAMNFDALFNGYRADVGYLGTGGFFVPKSVFDATGGFDSFYDPNCFEDTDMSFQIKKLGLKVCYRDLTGIRHQPHQTTNAS
jgi:GT2 family glycosyltransferase